MASEKTAITVLNTTLEWGASESATTKVIKITGIPDMGGEANTHDVSTTEDMVQVNILGRQTLDALTFEYFFDEDGTNFKAVEDSSHKKLFYKLKINGGSGGEYTWQGEHSSFLQSADDDNPLKATISIVASTKPTWKAPAGGTE